MVNVQEYQFARLELIFRCELPSGQWCDLAMITPFKNSRWKPRTVWHGCRICEPGKPQIISLEYLIRGALLVDTELTRLSGKHFFVDDLIDNDMFLRMGN
jgi:hypothetical protein